MSLKNKSRRKFLNDASKFSVATAGFYGLENLLQILFQKASAQAAGSTPYDYNYVNLMTPGAPPRWYFDQPLNPDNQSAQFIPGGFGTELEQKGSLWLPEYKCYKQKFGAGDVFLPPVWRLKSAAGEYYSSLLKEMIMVRGVDMEINSHDLNQERTVRPFSTSASISGLVGHASSAPTPSIGFTTSRGTNVFRGVGSAAGIAVSPTNPIPGITTPFNVSKVVKQDDLDYSIKQSLAEMDKFAKLNNYPSVGAEDNLDKTYDMFARNLASYQSNYTAIFNKYKAILAQETALEIPEISERSLLNSIKPDGSAVFGTAPSQTLNGSNLKTIYEASSAPEQMASAFAFCEFALSEKLTSSLTLDLGTTTFSNVGGVRMPTDQHYAGAVSSILFTTTFYRCMLACMLELRKALKAKNMYDKTLFHFSSEFSRTPQKTMAGSDHGFNSGSTSFISGMIAPTGAGLVGNIHKESADAREKGIYPGTWGKSAPTKFNDGKSRHIINDDVVSTVCEFMQIPKIGTKGQSLVSNSNGKFSLLVKEKKNVA
jgi:hypothetical protein